MSMRGTNGKRINERTFMLRLKSQSSPVFRKSIYGVESCDSRVSRGGKDAAFADDGDPDVCEAADSEDEDDGHDASDEDQDLDIKEFTRLL